MNTNNEENPNGVNERTSNSSQLSPGSGGVRNQACHGRHHAPETTSGSSKRRMYSREDNRNILRCYFASEPDRKGYRKRMKEIWDQSGGFEVTEQRLADQVRNIKKREWFTPEEMDELKPPGERDDQPQEVLTEETLCVEEERLNVEENRESSNDENIEPEIAELIIEIEERKGNIERDRSVLQSLRHIDRDKLQKEVRKIDSALKHVRIHNITDLNDTLYVCAQIVTSKFVTRKANSPRVEKGWKRRLKDKLVLTQKELSRIVEARNRDYVDGFRKRIELKFDIKKKGYDVVIEERKQRVKALSCKIKRYTDRIEQYRVNRLFQNNQKRYYQELNNGKTQEYNESPDQEATKKFWQEIWENSEKHDVRSPWIERVREELKKVERQDDMTLDLDKIRKAIRKLPNWKAAGPDRVQGFWIKNLKSLHLKVVECMNKCLDDGKVPEWMTSGRTVLIMKDKTKGTTPGNYRPITCLPVLWKLLTSTIADTMYEHLDANEVIGEEQMGCRRGRRGTKDHLLLDKAILSECKRRQKNLAMGWVDYQKAYDLVPHSWILESMNMAGVATNIIRLIKQSMPLWKTQLESNGDNLGRVSIKRGIFQGDSLSPLLFILALAPLSLLLKDLRQGYITAKGIKVNHLLFMDDLKIFARNKNDLEAIINSVRIFTETTRMKFGLQKCATLIMKRGKKIEDSGIEIGSDQIIEDIGESSYKYLGVLEADNIRMEEMKNKIKKEYKRRVKKVFKSKLNSGNTVKALNTWAVSLIRYSAGVLNWTVEELKKMDTSTRKLMTLNRMLHPRANVARLYLPREEGGKGMISVEECIRLEEYSLSDYIKRRTSKMSEALTEFEKDTSKEEYKQEAMKTKKDNWVEKTLHGQFLRLTRDVAHQDSWKWLKDGYLKTETEGMIMAAQDQALPTKWRKKNIEKQEGSALCRMCGQRDETVMHILSECSKLAQCDYKKRHDQVGKVIHWNLCKQNKIECSRNWYDHRPQNVTENTKVKILWDFSIQTDHVISARRPDIVFVNKEIDHTWIIDIAIPGDGRVIEKQREKVEKYQDLARELKRLWKTSVKVLPAVIGALGTLGSFVEDMGMLNIGKREIYKMQKTALLGSGQILRKVLDI